MMQMLLLIKEDSKCLREDNAAIKQRMDRLETGPTDDTTEAAASTSSTQPPPRKRRQQTTASSEDVIWDPIDSEEVRGTVKQRLTTLADPNAQLLEPPFNTAEDQPEQPLGQQEPWMPPINTRKQLPASGNQISGRHRTVDSTATHTVMWPQERVHDARGLRMKYEDLSWDKFVLGFLCCVSEAEPNLQPLLYMHLRELMVTVFSVFAFTFQISVFINISFFLAAVKTSPPDTSAYIFKYVLLTIVHRLNYFIQ
jgi:hypothetical protein